MSEPPLGFKLIWSDYTGYVEGNARLLKHGQKRASLPPKHVEVFRTRSEAEAAQARLRATAGEGLVVTITPVILRPPKPSPALFWDWDWPLQPKRLTP
jgi:hypothetical protein